LRRSRNSLIIYRRQKEKIKGDYLMVISAVHTLSARANLRQAHERQLEKAL
jgi:hypothetical protein